jgi:tetratricopeptide (TPR) repeat protein
MRWILVLLLLVGGGVAHADDTADAKRLFMSGTRHFDLTEFEAALNDYKEGYRKKDDPVFLYNIAQCYRLLNKNDEALRFYRSYLNRKPDAANRVEVETKIGQLQQAIAAQDQARSTPPTATLRPGEVAAAAPAPTTPPAPVVTATSGEVHASAERPTPIYKKWWLWAGVGGAVAIGLGVGLGVGLSQSSSGSTFPLVRF